MGCKMTAWIISVCGIALLTVLCDVIVPDGNTKKYVRTVIGIVLSFTILSPIASFFEDVAISVSSDNGDIAVQQQYLDGITEQKDLARVQNIKNAVEGLGISCNSVTLASNGYVLVSVSCDEQTLQQLQTILSRIENKIMIAWSNSGG